MFDQERYPEKVSEKTSETASEVENADLGTYAREELMDPEGDETLHRGLTARQISMIAVCIMRYVPYDSCSDNANVAWWCDWNWAYHRLGDSTGPWRSSWTAFRLQFHGAGLLYGESGYHVENSSHVA